MLEKGNGWKNEHFVFDYRRRRISTKSNGRIKSEKCSMAFSGLSVCTESSADNPEAFHRYVF